jgi:hypothetical protein
MIIGLSIISFYIQHQYFLRNCIIVETSTLCTSCQTGSARLTGFVFGLSPFPEGRKKTQSACGGK